MEPTSLLPDIPFTADERTMLDAFLDYYRTVVRRKGEGLTDEQLRTRLPGHPSPLTIGGLVKHLGSVEIEWSQLAWAGVDADDVPEPWRTGWRTGTDGEWEWAATEPGDEILRQYDDAVALARRTYSPAGLDDLAAKARVEGERQSLRWVLVHLVEEYARHAGHLDLLREHVDGVTDD